MDPGPARFSIVLGRDPHHRNPLSLQRCQSPKETTWSSEGGVDLRELQTLIQLLQGSDMVRPFDAFLFLLLLALDLKSKGVAERGSRTKGWKGGGPAEGRKKKSDLTDFDGGSGRRR